MIPIRSKAPCRGDGSVSIETLSVMERMVAEGRGGDLNALAAELGVDRNTARRRAWELANRGLAPKGWLNQKQADDGGLTPTRRKVFEAARRLVELGEAPKDFAIARDTGIGLWTVRFHRRWLERAGRWPQVGERETDTRVKVEHTPREIIDRPSTDLQRAYNAAEALACAGLEPRPTALAEVLRITPLTASLLVRRLIQADLWRWSGEPRGPEVEVDAEPARLCYARSAHADPDDTARKVAREMVANDRPERAEAPTLAEIVGGYIEEWRSGRHADLGTADDDVSEAA